MNRCRPSSADYAMLAIERSIDTWAKGHARGTCSWMTCVGQFTPRLRLSSVSCDCGERLDYPETQADRDEDARDDAVREWACRTASDAGARLRDKLASMLMEPQE